jgi:hypothetical protein
MALNEGSRTPKCGSLCGIWTLQPGDLIHADRHGAVAIRVEHVGALPDRIDQVRRLEGQILEAARSDDFSVEHRYVSGHKFGTFASSPELVGGDIRPFGQR